MIDAAAAAAVSPASKQARWDHKPVDFSALSFTTKVKLGWENSISVVFFFLPLLVLFLLLLKTHMLLPFFFFFWTAVAKQQNRE